MVSQTVAWMADCLVVYLVEQKAAELVVAMVLSKADVTDAQMVEKMGI